MLKIITFLIILLVSSCAIDDNNFIESRDNVVTVSILKTIEDVNDALTDEISYSLYYSINGNDNVYNHVTPGLHTITASITDNICINFKTQLDKKCTVIIYVNNIPEEIIYATSNCECVIIPN